MTLETSTEICEMEELSLSKSVLRHQSTVNTQPAQQQCAGSERRDLCEVQEEDEVIHGTHEIEVTRIS
jgi:hypothetical protein